MYVKKSDFEKARFNYEYCMSLPMEYNEICPCLMWEDYDSLLAFPRRKYNWTFTRYTVRILRKVYNISSYNFEYISFIADNQSKLDKEGGKWRNELLLHDFMLELFDVFHADDFELFSLMIDYLTTKKISVHIDYCNYMLAVCDVFNLTDYRALIMNYMHVCGIGQSDLVL